VRDDNHLTVLVPFFNYPDGLRRIIKQRKSEGGLYEVIVSNDSNYVFSFDKQFSNIKFLDGPRTGAINNWNFLLEHNRAAWSVLLHQDEVLIVKSPSKFRAALSETNTVYVTDLVLNFRTYRIVLSAKLRSFLMNSVPSFVLYCNFIGPTGCLIVPNNELRYCHDLTWLVDVEYYIRLKERYKFKPLPAVEVHSFVCHEDSISNRLTSRDKRTLRQEEIKEINGCYNPFKFYLLGVFWKLVRLCNTRGI
jgi:hypothetical protein